MIIRRPLSQSAIELSAQDFRNRFAAGVEGRLDLEPIIEFKVGLTIVPQIGLATRAGTYAYLSSDGKSIVVDARAIDEWPAVEYQGLLAHELAHWSLHYSLLPKVPLNSIAAFVRFHEALPDFTLLQLEHEARRWGRAVRMPLDELTSAFNDCIDYVRDSFPNVRGGARMYVESVVAGYFGVAIDHAEARLRDANLWRAVERDERFSAAVARSLKASGGKPSRKP